MFHESLIKKALTAHGWYILILRKENKNLLPKEKYKIYHDGKRGDHISYCFVSYIRLPSAYYFLEILDQKCDKLQSNDLYLTFTVRMSDPLFLRY